MALHPPCSTTTATAAVAIVDVVHGTQLEAPAAPDPAVAEAVVAALLLAEHEGRLEASAGGGREGGGGDDDEDVDDVFGGEAGDGGAADVFDGEVGDVGEGEVRGQLGLDGEEGGGPGGLVFVDPDFHGGGEKVWRVRTVGAPS